jgi:hypothetical protein
MISYRNLLYADQPPTRAYAGDQGVGKAKSLSFLEFDFKRELERCFFHGLFLSDRIKGNSMGFQRIDSSNAPRVSPAGNPGRP